jgi:hypothetical protein
MVEGVPEIERKFRVEALPEHLTPGSAIQQAFSPSRPSRSASARRTVAMS